MSNGKATAGNDHFRVLMADSPHCGDLFQQNEWMTRLLARRCEAAIECDQGRLCDLTYRQQIAIANRFRR